MSTADATSSAICRSTRRRLVNEAMAQLAAGVVLTSCELGLGCCCLVKPWVLKAVLIGILG
jgi:hypothetical protein